MTISMYEEILEGIGLTKGEIKVYTALLTLGETTTGKIITKAKLSSGKIYEILDKLIEKGLVTYIVKEKTKHYQATTPKKILEYITEKEKEIEEKRRQVEKILPSLEKLKKQRTKEYSAVIYKGIQGLKTAINETLERMSKKDEWLAFGISAERQKLINIVWDQFDRKKAKKGIKSKLIFNDEKSFKERKSKYNEGNKVLKMKNQSAPIGVAGDVVMIYADSLLHIPNDEGEMYGHSRLIEDVQALAHASAQEVAQGILEAACAFAGSVPLDQDLLLVVLRRTPE